MPFAPIIFASIVGLGYVLFLGYTKKSRMRYVVYFTDFFGSVKF